MARNTQFTTQHAAAHVAQYLDAQSVAAAQVLTLDEQIDKLNNDVQIAKAANNTAELARLRLVYLELKEQIDAEAATTADLEAEAALPFEPTVCELRELAALPPLGRCDCDYRICIDLDCLIAAHEAQPDTKQQASAWEWLATLTSVTMRGTSYRIPSARWSSTVYTSTAETCSCDGFAHGRKCWHVAAARTLDLAREHEVVECLAARDAYADLLECY